jgi:hypothetical protein
MIAAIVDTDALLQVIWASVAAGVGVTSCYGLAILGATRAVEFGKDGRLAGAAAFAVLGFLGFAVVIAAIVFGILMLVDD